MAVLGPKTGDLEMTLRPIKIQEEGKPTWIIAELEFRQGQTKLLATTFSLTRGDLAELRTGLREVSSGRRAGFTITTMDADFILEAQVCESPGDASVAFWIGEPYVLMKGYRFIVTAADLERFACDLQADEDRVMPANPL